MQHPTPEALRRTLVRRSLRRGVVVFSLIFVALAIGAIGYHFLDNLSWLDATLNASMILTGMGPVNPISSPAGKVFAILYSLGSGVFFLTMVAVLLGPFAQHILHRFHLDRDEELKRNKKQP